MGTNVTLPDHREQLPNTHPVYGSICRNAMDNLNRSGLIPLQHVLVVEDGSRLKLKGWVPSYHMKQMAQALVMKTEGVESIQNDIEVW
ncbi:MAG: hypothetical protein CMJ46_09350 [Planctomyces sp.]|nr:hypothetical protein [Planctomyces sp.]